MSKVKKIVLTVLGATALVTVVLAVVEFITNKNDDMDLGDYTGYLDNCDQEGPDPADEEDTDGSN